MHHLTVRVAWHDSQWNGTVCAGPKHNPFCLSLDRVRVNRQDDAEETLKTQHWADLQPDQMPPCVAESAGFMTPREWRRVFVHPYHGVPKAASTHGPLKATPVRVPEYATFAVPYAWMLRQNQEAIDQSLPQPLPADEDPPFPSPWVFGRDRQEALLELVFGRVTNEKSLVFFYCKEGQPLGDLFSRLVVGVGRVTKVSSLLWEGASKMPARGRAIRLHLGS